MIERRNYWTQWQDNMTREMWEAGETCAMIGMRLGKSKSAVAARARRLDLPMRYSPVMPPAKYLARIDQMAELLARGFDVAEAAREIGITYETGRGMFRRICADLGAQAS